MSGQSYNRELPCSDRNPGAVSWGARSKVLWLALWTSACIIAVGLSDTALAEDWGQALAQMPLHNSPAELNRTNCVPLLLEAFQSNQIVKALVFMPGATDEFYLFRRARAVLQKPYASLFDAICALTNQTYIQADFRRGFLLLHTTEDPLEPDNRVDDQATQQKLSGRIRVAHLNCNDRDWDFLQPILKRSLKIALRPWRYSRDSWHFYRHSFAAWDLDGMQALEVAALAGKSRFVLAHKEARFEVDPRVGPPPRFDAHLR